MAVLAARYHLRVPDARTLKDRRMALRPVVDRVRHRLHCSIAEVGPQDDLRGAVLEVAVVGASPGAARERLDAVDRVVWSAADLEVTDVERWWLDDA